MLPIAQIGEFLEEEEEEGEGIMKRILSNHILAGLQARNLTKQCLKRRAESNVLGFTARTTIMRYPELHVHIIVPFTTSWQSLLD